MTHPPSAAPSTLPPETLIALAYLGGWTTGALVWLIEREDRKVRFHIQNLRHHTQKEWSHKHRTPLYHH